MKEVEGGCLEKAVSREEALAIEVDLNLPAQRVIRVLERVIA